MDRHKIRSYNTYGPLRAAAFALVAGLALPAAAHAQSRARPAPVPPPPVVAPRPPLAIPRPPLAVPRPLPVPRVTPIPPLSSPRLRLPNTGVPPVLGSNSGQAALNRFHRTLESQAARSLRPGSSTIFVYPYVYPFGLYGVGGLVNPYSPFVGPYGYDLYNPYSYYPYGYPYQYNPPVAMPAPVIPPEVTSPLPYVYTQPYIYSENERAVPNQKVDPAVQQAAKDIEKAWLTDNLDLIAKYVRRDAKITIQGGQVEAETQQTGGDYLDSMRKAFAQKTVAFTFDPPEFLKQDAYLLIGHRTTRDAHGDEQTVLIAYTLQKMDWQYYITQVQTY